jgi:hypothetical protein
MNEPFMPCSGAPSGGVTVNRGPPLALQPNFRLRVPTVATLVSAVPSSGVAENFCTLIPPVLVALGTLASVDSLMSPPVSESFSTFCPVTAAVAILLACTAWLARSSPLTWPLAILGEVTALPLSLLVVTAPLTMSSVPMVAAAYPTPPIDTNRAISEITSAGDGRSRLSFLIGDSLPWPETSDPRSIELQRHCTASRLLVYPAVTRPAP